MFDFAEAYAAQRAAVYVANTGFGYGDTVANALRAADVDLRRADRSQRDARRRLAPRDAQVLQHDGFLRGLRREGAVRGDDVRPSFWSVGAAARPAPDIVPPSATSRPSRSRSTRAPSASRCLDAATSGGRPSTTSCSTRTTASVQPAVALDGTLPATDPRRIHGAFITSLNTDDVMNVDPFNALPMVDLAANEPERTFQQTFFRPAVHVTQSREGLITNQSVVVITGHAPAGRRAGDRAADRRHRPSGRLLLGHRPDEAALPAGRWNDRGRLAARLRRRLGPDRIGPAGAGVRERRQRKLDACHAQFRRTCGALDGDRAGAFTAEPELIFQGRATRTGTSRSRRTRRSTTGRRRATTTDPRSRSSRRGSSTRSAARSAPTSPGPTRRASRAARRRWTAPRSRTGHPPGVR